MRWRACSTSRRGSTYTLCTSVRFPVIGEGFEFYYGAGANLGSWDYDDGEFTFGVNGIIGLEYKIRELPLAFSLDYKPNLNVIGKTGFHAADFGLGIRVAF